MFGVNFFAHAREVQCTVHMLHQRVREEYKENYASVMKQKEKTKRTRFDLAGLAALMVI